MEKISKKEKRIESKKRKAKAFLELTKEIEEVKKEEDDSDDEAGPQKKSKTAETAAQSNPLDELAKYRQLLKERQKASMEKPKVYLLLDDLQFQHSKQMSEDLTFKELPPLFILDLQHLLMYALQGNVSSYKPRWCRLLRVGKVSSVVVMVMDGVSSHEFQTYPDCFPRLKAEFDMSIDMVSPEQYGSTVQQDLFNIPLSNAVLRSKLGKLGKETKKIINNLNKPPGYKVANEEKKKDTDPTKPEPIGFLNTEVSLDSSGCHKNDTYTRTSLLLSSSQMIAEGFPLPIHFSQSGTYDDFVYSKDHYTTVTSQSPMFAIDCEMCITSTKKFELTRVSVINEELETVYDSFVKPYNKIVDYVTRYSGVTKAILDPVKTRLGDVQKFLQKTLPSDAILCGQSLRGDLFALKMFHPYIIDTSVIFNLTGNRSMKTGLKRLAAHFLGKDIQDSELGHSSVEDAVTTMELVQLKLKQSPDFGDIVNNGAIFPQAVDDSNETSSSNQKQADDSNKSNNQSKNMKDKEKINNKKIVDKTSSKKSDVNSCDNKKCSEKQSEVNAETHCTCSENDTEENVKKCEHCLANNADKKSNLIEQRKAFFVRAGSQVYERIFKLMKDHNKMVGLIEKPDTLEEYKQDFMTAIPTNCDRETKSSGKSLVQFHDFVFMNFPSYRDAVDIDNDEEKQKMLWKQDKRMSKVLKHTRPNSLVVVVMTGRSHGDQNYSARTFVKIT